MFPQADFESWNVTAVEYNNLKLLIVIGCTVLILLFLCLVTNGGYVDVFDEYDTWGNDTYIDPSAYLI
jgi:hypothetical protein